MCAGCAAVFAWLWSGITSDMKEIDKDIKAINATIQTVKTDHNKYETYVEKEFEKRETIQYSLSRIHDRLDKIVEIIGGGKHG